MATSNVTTKRCNKCGKDFPATKQYFYESKSCRDGFRGECRACNRANYRAYYAANADREKARTNAWNNANKDWVYERNRVWRKANSERVKKYERLRVRVSPKHRAYLEANRDKSKAYYRVWRKNHPEAGKAYVHNRRALKLSNGGTHTAADISLQLKTQKGRCWWCGGKLNKQYHVDHRIPLVKGGSNGPENLCIACPSCNLSKSAKMPWEFNGRLL